MIRNYSNEKIYKNFKIVTILSFVSILISIITIIAYTCIRYINFPNSGIDENQIIFYVFAILIPISPFINSVTSMKANGKVFAGKFRSETKLNNDFSNLICQIIATFLPLILLIIYCFLFVCFGSPNPGAWANMCGRMLPAHVFIYIADGFLIHNCILIKREWKNDPPEFVKKQQIEKERKKTEQTNNQNMKLYQSLIQKCGVKFFIKYYKQINRLPLRDVTISENYTSMEREERLYAAKKIIDLNLTEFTLKEILKTYSDILDATEIEQVKSLLTELQS